MKPIHTPRMVIRPVTEADEDALRRVYGDAELMLYITGRARTIEETRERLDKDLRLHATHGFGLCLADDRETGELVGRCGIEPRPVQDGLENGLEDGLSGDLEDGLNGDLEEGGEGRVDGELAWLVMQDRWGQGLATEMARALIDFATDHPGITRVFARAHPENRASIHIMEKMEMRFVAEDAESVEYEVPGWVGEAT